MNQPNSQSKLSVKSSAVTDRGLNKKRPLNEDSFLADSERGIFSVADGVGGAEAGEVASQTAIEVLDEAFRHHPAGADIEDLMELAIQRANASIHQMSQDHAKFSMMATTIVVLHIDGNIATIGHVGDSRLYRLTPEGQLVRETEDHSVVEEEVRAGRMTAEQAANHPSKNVISRAIGAESGVEVDMKVIEVEDGTEFLLCTDGITRHIPDHELRQMLLVHDDLPTLCAELKERCYSRGAEDNLTAVIVRVGSRISADRRAADLEKTISPETNPVPVLAATAADAAAPTADVVTNAAPTTTDTAPLLVPASRAAFTPAPHDDDLTLDRTEKRLEVAAPREKSGVERTMTRLLLFVLVLGALVGAFYGGRKYKGPVPFLDPGEAPIAAVTPTPAIAEDPAVTLTKTRNEVDADPYGWLDSKLKDPTTKQNLATALDSFDPEFLYLYGRASLLTHNNEEASRAFQSVIDRIDRNPSPANASLRRDATFGLAAVALALETVRPAAFKRLVEVTPDRAPSPPVISPAVSPAGSQLPSPLLSPATSP